MDQLKRYRSLATVRRIDQAGAGSASRQGRLGWLTVYSRRLCRGIFTHVLEILRLIRNQDLWRDVKRRSFSPQRRQTCCDEHKAIVEPLSRRDAEAAARAMRTHMDTVSRNLFASNGAAQSRIGQRRQVQSKTPASTTKPWLVIARLSSDARNSTASAISRGATRRASFALFS